MMRLWPITGLIIATTLTAASAMAESALSLYKAEYKTKVAGLNVTLTDLTEKWALPPLSRRQQSLHGRERESRAKRRPNSRGAIRLSNDGISNRRREVLFYEEADDPG